VGENIAISGEFYALFFCHHFDISVQHILKKDEESQNHISRSTRIYFNFSFKWKNFKNEKYNRIIFARNCGEKKNYYREWIFVI